MHSTYTRNRSNQNKNALFALYVTCLRRCTIERIKNSSSTECDRFFLLPLLLFLFLWRTICCVYNLIGLMQVKRNPPLFALTIQINNENERNLKWSWTVCGEHKKSFERSPVSIRANRVVLKQVETIFLSPSLYLSLVLLFFVLRSFNHVEFSFHKALSFGSKQIDSGNWSLWCNWFQCTDSNAHTNKKKKQN